VRWAGGGEMEKNTCFGVVVLGDLVIDDVQEV